MQTSNLDLDNFNDFKQVIEEENTKENGWKSVYDGVLRKDFPSKSPFLITPFLSPDRFNIKDLEKES